MSSTRRRSADAPGSSGAGHGMVGGSASGPPSNSPGWRYTLRVPSWSQAQLPGGESAVFYQVEVTVLPPQGEPRKRSVGRRFSNFVTLHRRLREEVGPAALRGLDPPPRRSLAGVNRKPELVEQRRWELEQWLWRLTESPVIANSVMMFHFCELDAAARMRPRMAAVLRTSPPLTAGGGGGASVSQLDSPLGSAGTAGAAATAVVGFLGASSSGPQMSPMHSYAPSWSGSEASDLLFGESSTSSLAAATATTTATLAAGDSPAGRPHQQQRVHTPLRQQHTAASLHGHSDTRADTSSWRQQAAQLPANSSVLAGVGQLRLALPVQQRGAAKAVARLLREQLAMAQADLQDAVRTIAGDQQAIAQLAAEVQQLHELQQLQEEAQDGDGRGAAAVAALAALRQQLVAVEAERDALLKKHQQQDAAQDAGGDAQQQQKLATLQAERDELQQRVQEAQQQLAAAQAEVAVAQQVQQAAQQGQEEERQQLLGVLEEQCSGLQAQLREAQVAAVAAAAEKEAGSAKSREDLKLLAKEVKALRMQLAAVAQEQQQGAALQEEHEWQQQQLLERDAEIAGLREQLGVAQAAAADTLVQQPATSNGIIPAATATEQAEQQQQQMEKLLEAAGALRKLLDGCGVNGSEAASAGGAAAVISRLNSANQQLASIRLQVQQQLLEGPAAAAEAPQQGSSRGDSRQLRELLAGLLLDAAFTKQQQHDLLRSTCTLGAQLQGLEERLLSPTASPVRRAPTA